MNFFVLFSFTSFEQGIHFLRGLCDFSKKFWSDRFFVTKCTLFLHRDKTGPFRFLAIFSGY